MKFDTISIGEAMAEFSPTPSDNPDETGSYQLGWGGDTSNVVVGLSRLGKKVGYITQVGDDELGHGLLNMWKDNNVDTTKVKISKNGWTGLYLVSLLDRGHRDFTYFRKGSAASLLRPSDLDLKYLKSTRVLHVSGIGQAISKSCRDSIDRAITIVRENGGLISYDPNIRTKLLPLEEIKKIVFDTLPLVDILLPSIDDAVLLYGRKTASELTRRLLSKGPKVVAMKMGVNGCIVGAASGKNYRIRGHPVHSIDTTGAGDAFDAGFLASYLDGDDVVSSAATGNFVAALKVQQLGATKGLPTLTEVKDFSEGKQP